MFGTTKGARFRQIMPAPGWVLPVLIVEEPYYLLRPLVGWALVESQHPEDDDEVLPLVVDEGRSGHVITARAWDRHTFDDELYDAEAYYLGRDTPILESAITDEDRQRWRADAQRQLAGRPERVVRLRAAREREAKRRRVPDYLGLVDEAVAEATD